MTTTSRSTRVQRVERELFELLNHFLLQGWGTPLPCYATITACEVSSDLRYAKLYVRLVGDDKATAAGEKVIEAARPLFQKHVATELSGKFCPVLKFAFGRVAKLDEIDALFENLRKPKNFGE